MRVLITDVTAESGRSLARRLLAAGHEVVGHAVSPHRYLDPRVRLITGKPNDAGLLRRAAEGCDSVVHVATSGGRCQAAAVGTAAASAGARVVLVVAAADARSTEEALRETGADSLVVRIAPLVGRRADGAACTTMTRLLRSPSHQAWQVLHHDDLDQFLVRAVAEARTGVVELAADGTVTAALARSLLRAAGVSTLRPVGRWARRGPALDSTTALGTWGFRTGWSAVAAVEDLARGLAGRSLRRGGALTRSGEIPLRGYQIPHRVPACDGHPLTSADLEANGGEFDDLIDPRFPVYSATNTSEALPGPMTPMTLDLHSNGIRLANETMADILALAGTARDQFISRVVSVYGHHVYLNASVSVISATNMPGWDADSMRDDVFGNLPTDWQLMPLGRPVLPTGWAKLRASTAAVRRTVATARRYKATAALVNAASRREARAGDQLAELTDEQFEAMARLWRDRLNQCWAVAATGVLMVGSATAIYEKRNGGGDLGIDVTTLDSAKPMLAVERLAGLCRADQKLRALAQAGDVQGARAHSPAFAEALDEELAEVGHRGPGECELVNQSFSDRPAVLCTAAGNAATRPAPMRTRAKAVGGRTARLAAGATVARERARDAVVRYNHCLRLAVRERTARLVAAGALDAAEDGFYLTFDELFDLRSGAAGLVARRRAERARLGGLRMPNAFNGSWAPDTTAGDVEGGGTVTGLGVAGGIAEGPVKVIRSPDDDIEPGDVLVAPVTDTGHTAMFGYAAAVVTDIGGAASHAAIVAREFGIPCVVDTKTATAQLRDGQLIRVDGTSGTVTVLSELASAHASD